MALQMQKSICGGINIDNLINSTCLYQKNWVQVFCLNFIRVHMFFDDNHSKLVPESTNSEVY